MSGVIFDPVYVNYGLRPLSGLERTNALRQIPGYEKIMEVARQRNPNRRLTQPEDVRCIAALRHPATYWLTGNTLHVDGGENIVG